MLKLSEVQVYLDVELVETLLEGTKKMSFVPQKELVTGVERHPLDADVPNVIEKLFALKNQCTECNVCEVACSLVHSPDGTVNPQYARLKIDHAPDKASRVNPDGLGFIAEICHHCGNPPPCA
ncbi:MAG: hypothetical protein HOM64_03445, partial [Proteobacteria bacterium]|nr:hypothetical protein [Pseudomonadota bacterium]